MKSANAAGNLVNTTAAFKAAAALDPDDHLVQLVRSILNGPLDAAANALATEVASAVDAGIVVCFSAGNGGWGFPAQMPEVIAVGGVFMERDGSMRASDYASGFMSNVYPARRVPDISGLVGMRPRAAYIMLPLSEGARSTPLSRRNPPERRRNAEQRRLGGVLRHVGIVPTSGRRVRTHQAGLSTAYSGGGERHLDDDRSGRDGRNEFAASGSSGWQHGAGQCGRTWTRQRYRSRHGRCSPGRATGQASVLGRRSVHTAAGPVHYTAATAGARPSADNPAPTIPATGHPAGAVRRAEAPTPTVPATSHPAGAVRRAEAPAPTVRPRSGTGSAGSPAGHGHYGRRRCSPREDVPRLRKVTALMGEPPMVVARVLLRSAEGHRPGIDVPITADTLGRLTPPPETVAAVADHFGRAGFAVLGRPGITIGISGSKELFERHFGIELKLGADRAYTVGQTHVSRRRGPPSTARAIQRTFPKTTCHWRSVASSRRLRSKQPYPSISRELIHDTRPHGPVDRRHRAVARRSTVASPRSAVPLWRSCRVRRALRRADSRRVVR